MGRAPEFKWILWTVFAWSKSDLRIDKKGECPEYASVVFFPRHLLTASPCQIDLSVFFLGIEKSG